MNPTLPLTVFLLAPAIASAQPELDLAAKAGMNAATQDENFRVNRYGLSGGAQASAQWSASDRFSLGPQLEVLYTPRGAEVELEGERVGKLREHYLDFVLALRSQARLGAIDAYVVLGGGLNLLLSASKDDDVGSDQDITDGLHRIDIALLGAAGVAFRVPRRDTTTVGVDAVFLEARHDIGLLDVDRGGGFKNRTTSVMLGVSFLLGGRAAPPPPDKPEDRVATP